MKTMIDLNASDIRAALFDWLEKNRKELVHDMKVEITFAGTGNELEARVHITEKTLRGDARDQ